MKRQRSQPWLLAITVRALKYVWLALVGLTLTYLVALALGFGVLAALVSELTLWLLPRALVLLGCLVAIATVSESMRS